MKKIFFLLIIAGLLSSCNNEVLENTSDLENLQVESRGLFNDGYFDWDRIINIPYKTNTSEGELSLPWAPGNSQSAGIPSEWIDKNAESQNMAERYYSRENGWSLVYSNLFRRNQLNKYFTLYNEKTGILRFFFYAISGSFTAGTTNTFAAINTTTRTSLLNFNSTIAQPINAAKESPAVANSMVSTFDGQTGITTGVGFRADTWYGLDVQCAYDPALSSTSATFNIKLFSNTITITKGELETTGSITGTITGMASNMPNISLSNMFNTNNTATATTNFTINNTQSIASSLGIKIDEGVAKKDKFFTTLWNNIKSGITSGAQSGAQSGIKSIFDGGASAVANTLNGFLTSFLGGGADNSISKVDLGLKANTTMKSESEMLINGWEIREIPISGTQTNDVPFYNKPLGVWNLKENPSVTVDITNYTGRYATLDNTYTNYEYSVSVPQVIVNPAANMSIKKVTYTLIIRDGSDFKGIESMKPFAILNGVNYRGNGCGASADVYYMRGSLKLGELTLRDTNPYVYVNLELTDRATGKSYFYGKYFELGKFNLGKVKNIINDYPVYGGGNGGFNGGPNDGIAF